MLPDLPTLKKEVLELYLQYMQRRIHESLGVFQQVGRHTCFEGDRLRTVRADGTAEDSAFKRSSIEMYLPFDQAATLTPIQRIEMLNNRALELAEDITRNLFESLDKTLSDTGQVVDMQGQGLNAEALLAVLKKLEMEFEDNGQHSPLTIATGSLDATRQMFAQLKHDPALAARYEEIISEKKVDWRAREAARKLVG